MNEFNKRDFPKADVPPESTFITAMPECEPLLLSHFIAMCSYVLSVDAARMGVIPLEEFEQHCINHHHSRDAGFETEYEVCLQKYSGLIKT